MFRITSKVKIAAGLAAGALTLGAGGAYAAANANNTITVTATPISVGGKTGTSPLKLIGFNGTTTLTLPTFTNAGECVSFLAQNKNIALDSTLGTHPGAAVPLSKNYHGKLMSAANEWCKTQLTSAPQIDGAETADATDSTDSTTSQGNGHGHSNHAPQTD